MTYLVKPEAKASVSTSQIASYLDLFPDNLSVFAFHHLLDVEARSSFMSTILLVSYPSPRPAPSTIFQTATDRIVEQEEKVLSIRFCGFTEPGFYSLICPQTHSDPLASARVIRVWTTVLHLF